MKLYWTVSLAAFALLAVAAGAFAAKIVVENESYQTIKPSMVLKADSTASKGKCIERPLNRPHATTETGPSDTGHALYKIKVPANGAYQFWGRCWWYDACGNSFFILVDTDKVTNTTPYITDQTFKKWHWVAGPVLNLKAGVRTIRIQYREDGARMDQFILTTTPKNRWQPVRAETETSSYVIRGD